MTEIDIRFECVRLALHATSANVVLQKDAAVSQVAAEIYDFVTKPKACVGEADPA